MDIKQARWDDWQNLETGHGTARDKTTYTEFLPGYTLDPMTLDNLYSEGGMASRVCEAYPEQYFKNDFKIKITRNGEVDSQLSSEIKSDLDALNTKTDFTDSFVWRNVFGISVLFLVTDDDDDLASPLDLSRVTKIANMNIIDRHDIMPLTFYNDTSHPKYGRIETFLINNVTQTASKIIVPTGYSMGDIVHESRCIFFEGQRTSNYRRRVLHGWNISFLQQVYGALKSYGMSFKSLDVLIHDANVGVLKFKGYYDFIARSDFSAIQSRLERMDIQKSTVRSVVVDADSEEYERQNFTWTGLDKPYNLVMLNLSAQTKIPVTILMGREPAGENATGEADFKGFYDRATSDQKNQVTPKLVELINVLCAIRKVEYDSIDVIYEPLNDIGDDKKAAIKKLVAEADKLDIENGTITSEEIQRSRFTAEGWSMDTYPDLEMRDRINKADLDNEGTLDDSKENETKGLDPSQITAIMSIVTKIHEGESGISPRQAKSLLKISFPQLSPKEINALVKK